MADWDAPQVFGRLVDPNRKPIAGAETYHRDMFAKMSGLAFVWSSVLVCPSPQPLSPKEVVQFLNAVLARSKSPS